MSSSKSLSLVHAVLTCWGLTTAAAASGGPFFPDSNVQCSSKWRELNWPTFHIVNNVTKRANGNLDMEPLNDANGIFYYKGLWHVMFQSGDGPPPWGYRWAHKVSDDLVHWFPLADALRPDMSKGTSWDDLGPCDGTVSFPDLGRAPFDGSSPVILYGPDCGKPLDPAANDVPRIELALPADPSDPYLSQWINSKQPGPAVFDGTPCSFPGRVWKSEVGPYWNMLCILNGTGPWARFTADDASLMHWKHANTSFVKGAVVGGGAGAMFHRIPNAPVGGPTHLINGGTGEVFFLGTYDATTEVLTVNPVPQKLDGSTADNFAWAATGTNGPDPATESERLLIVAWIYGPPAPNAISLVREITWDATVGRLIAFPVPEYTKLRNAIYMEGKNLGPVAPNESKTLPLPTGAGGTADILVSFDLNGVSESGFGMAVRAPPDRYAGVAAVTMTVEKLGAPDSKGARQVGLSFVTPDPKTDHDSNGNASIVVLPGETLDVRVLIDKPIIEFFVNGGRASYVAADNFYSSSASSVHIFNSGSSPVVASNVSAYGMGCGWTHTKPVPVQEHQALEHSLVI